MAATCARAVGASARARSGLGSATVHLSPGMHGSLGTPAMRSVRAPLRRALSCGGAPSWPFDRPSTGGPGHRSDSTAGAAARRVVRLLDTRDGSQHYALHALDTATATLATRGVREGEAVSIADVAPVYTTNARSNHQRSPTPRWRLLSPVDPPIIVGTGLNYRRHAEECGLQVPAHPILAFFKHPTAAQHPGLPIVIPKVCDPRVPEVDWEAELAIIIGRECRDVSASDALDYVRGYTAANDVSARVWQTEPVRTAGQWNRGKGFDTFCPLGPAIVLQERGFDPHKLGISLTVNGETMQSSNTSDFVFSVGEVIEFMSKDTTLLPGTVILTGTPEGIGMFQDPPRYLAPGDEVSVTIEGIGTLTNPVAAPGSDRRG